MNRNSIIGFVLIFLIFIGFSIYMAPSDAEKKAMAEKQKHLNDSIQKAQEVKDRAAIKDSTIIISDTSKIVEQQSTANSPVIQNDSTVLINKFGDFAASSKGDSAYVFIENEVIKLKISKKGGFITYVELKNYKTYDSLPLVLFNNETSNFSFLLNDKQIQSKDLYFDPVIQQNEYKNIDTIKVKDGKPLKLGMRLYPNDANLAKDPNKYFELEYTIDSKDYMIGMKLNLHNVSEHVAPGYNDLLLYWDMAMMLQEKDAEQERKECAIFYKFKNEDVEDLNIAKEDNNENLDTKVAWISYKQKFFAASLIADESFKSAKIDQSVSKRSSDKKYLKTMRSQIFIPLTGGEIQSIGFKMYLGPTKYNILKTYNLDLEKQIPLGWGFFLLHWINRFAVIPVFDFLSNFGWNYGIIILILTIILKLVLFPIAYKTYVSSAKMRILKPEVDEISQKYPKKEDALKKQQATMALYKKAGANPLSGCVPMLLQMPILIAMFRFFPASIELRQQAFLWAEDLSSYDAIFSWTAQIPLLSQFYGNHVSLFTLLMTITTIFYTKINNDMMGSTQQQLPGMKTMMYLMPILFLGFFNNYSSGLSYYYFLANIFTFIQMFAIRKFINEDKIHARIQENKKKPVKKSAFQQKMEDLAKQRGVNLKK